MRRCKAMLGLAQSYDNIAIEKYEEFSTAFEGLLDNNVGSFSYSNKCRAYVDAASRELNIYVAVDTGVDGFDEYIYEKHIPMSKYLGIDVVIYHCPDDKLSQDIRHNLLNYFKEILDEA